MADQPQGAVAQGRWARLWTQPRSRWLLGIPAGGLLAFVIGAAAFYGGASAWHYTSSAGFCADACHEMSAFSTPEWRASVHYVNTKGLHAGCPNCHVPGPFVPMLLRKVQALGEGWGHLTGTIATREKYEAMRPRMAEHVWAYMKASDSRECRHCHDRTTMDLAKQDKPAQRAHERMAETGKTCIDCHKGVAHTLPPGVAEAD
jgi:cytochrome c-type protein NapC